MAENFNICIITTAGYSPWSNGLLERHNQPLTEILMKIKHEQDLDWETALNWALMAKNSLHNVHGYSPYQLVFGRNPNIPSALTDQPPALEGTTTSEVVRNHINALYSARQAFTKAESSEKIRRGLRKQVRTTPDTCTAGDKVYYKRPDNKKWRGPGVVIGQDGPVVFVQHGGLLVRIHKCRLRLVDPTNKKGDSDLLSDIPSNHGPEKQADPIQNFETSENSDDEQYIQTSPTLNHNNDTTANEKILIKPGHTISYTHKESQQQIQAKVIS